MLRHDDTRLLRLRRSTRRTRKVTPVRLAGACPRCIHRFGWPDPTLPPTAAFALQLLSSAPCVRSTTYAQRSTAAPYTLYPAPIPYPIPYTLYPIPYTLYPIPYTLYPIPYTVHMPSAGNKMPRSSEGHAPCSLIEEAMAFAHHLGVVHSAGFVVTHRPDPQSTLPRTFVTLPCAEVGLVSRFS